MADLKTTYMGLDLSHPIIAGASALTGNMDSIKRIEDGGAAALVTKSLFEEQIQLERMKFEEDQEKDNYRHPEMITVRPDMKFAGPDEHLMWVRKAKEAVDIPVIASLNAVNRDTWVEYARKLQETGVDALECNLFTTPRKVERDAASIESDQIELVRELKQSVSIPVSLKLSFFYANPLNVVQRMDDAGADAVVLFNRLLEPDIDVNEQTSTNPFNFSYDTDYRLALRYAGLLEGAVGADLCCSTGIYTGETVVRLLLAGATAVQTVSAVYRRGFKHIATMRRDLETWMASAGYGSLSEFRGKLSKRHSKDPWAYTRSQYARLLLKPEEIIENVPTM